MDEQLSGQDALSLIEKYSSDLEKLIIDYGLKLLAAIAIVVIGFWLAKKISAAIARSFRKTRG